ncbi:MAG: fimbria/pilus outer membrane usher protein [Stenotrophomonas sp.]|uniref:fimbria/pilus outer membrane usher protein n=1 Tax=Stenotrophomonas sp. TaxID=69392 RepID=UPI003D6CED6E
MTTPNRKHCRRSPLAHRLCQAIATAVAALILPEGSANDATTVAAGEQELYLEARVNQASNGKLARFVLRGDTLLASEATLWELGLILPVEVAAQRLIELPSLAGLSVEYDAPHQRINLQVPVDMLDRPPVHMDLSRTQATLPDPSQRLPGATLSYDVYGQHADGRGNLSGFSELRVFGVGRGVWSNTLSSRFTTGNTHRRASNTRLDSSWQLDFPVPMLSLTVGDTMTSSQEWSRATRIGGIRLSRNFALQPYRTITPLASFAGEAVLPSTVDLYIDGIRQSSQPLPPGRFQLDSSPSLSGTGQAQLVITDLNGQSRTIGFSLYGTPQLLQAGLSDWSVELGSIRRDYGIRSFNYGNDPLASASLSYGVNNHLTLQTHAEGSHGIRQAGAGAVLLLGKRGGVLTGSWAGSRAGTLTGNQHGLGYQWNSPRFSASASTQRRSAGYRDVAAVHEGATLPRRTEQAFLGVTTPAGHMGVSYVTQHYLDFPRSRYASLSWSHSLADNMQLSLSFNRDLANRDSDSAFLYWSMPLDRYLTTSASARHDRGGNGLSVEASRSADLDQGGLGWRAQATTQGSDDFGLRAEISQHGRHGHISAGVDHDNGSHRRTSTYASAGGGLALLDGRLYSMPRVHDAFALVSTSGIADVPVQLENRTIGVTDQRGQLLINHLNAWQRNQLSIDPLDLPADMVLETTRKDVVPETRSGVQVDFPMRRTLAMQFGVRDRDGQWLPAGSHLTVEAPDNPPTTTLVGHEGKVYLLDPPPQARLHFRSDNAQCTAPLPEAPIREGRINLEDVVCQ